MNLPLSYLFRSVLPTLIIILAMCGVPALLGWWIIGGAWWAWIGGSVLVWAAIIYYMYRQIDNVS
jgi:hypothetical protein